MQTFQCTHCNSLVFFESQTCIHCGSPLGFDTQSLRLIALELMAQGPTGAVAHVLDPPVTSILTDSITAPSPQAPTAARWFIKHASGASFANGSPAEGFKFCQNAFDHQNCNFLLSVSDPAAYCRSCRQTETIPNLSNPGNFLAWTTIENAKRRLYYTLAKLGLGSTEQPPRYEFLQDIPDQDPVMTGHASGLITLNIAEADDAERTRRRINLHEPYRTLLGHLRHEVGHFYWDQFFLQDDWALSEFRALFGDESIDYGQALEQHYTNPRMDWQLDHISQYAASHPWEDWAETWAHYLHLVDLQETAASYQMQFATHGNSGSIFTKVDDPFALFAQGAQDGSPQDIGPVLNQTMGVSLLLNSLNRSLGHNDAYPFALSSAVLQKLAFVHNAVRRYVHNKTPSTPHQAVV